MLSLRTILKGGPQSGASSTLRVADGLHLPFPVSVLDLAKTLEPIQATYPLNTGTCSGSCEVSMSSDGVCRFRGSVHDSGALPAVYTVIVALPVDSIGPVLFNRRGNVGGTFSFVSRDDSWDKTATDSRIANSWVAVKAAMPGANVLFGTDTGAFQLLDGLVAGTSGFFVFKLAS
jgi:hypothetical protein